MMTLEQLRRVRAEMDRLDDKIVELIAAEEVAWEEQARLEAETGRSGYTAKPLSGSALSGAVRRASMDLTRELAELRRY